MAKRKKRAAEVLYATIDDCTLRDGRVRLVLRSGGHVEHSSLTVRAAMELYDRLGGELRQLATIECMGCAHRGA
ncbi:MAG TPA: hypothetical protein PKY87_14605 [Terricaulis sp.]|nr:hypothetical protein [Terricaulis sp.]